MRRGRRSGLFTIVAVHSTARGPSLGGCRMWTYRDEREAVRDALRLSRAMTFKAAVANLPLGGGKGVIMRHAGEPNANPSAGIAFFDLDPPKLRILARVVELHSEAAAAAAAG